MQLLIHIDRANGQALQIQIYEAVRQLILGGVLKAGQRLPSTRSVCAQLGVARNTVVLAYERLVAEDYVASRAKAGVFVNGNLPEAAVLTRNARATARAVGTRSRQRSAPGFAPRMPELWRERAARPRFDFFVGRPHPDSFPTGFWRRSVTRHLTYAHGIPTEYGDPRGLLALRAAIAEHLRATRGIESDADQVLITAGIQGALNLLARVFLGTRWTSSVAVENPCYQGAAFVFNSYGARIRPIAVDAHGMLVSRLESFSGKLVYVTPSHQFPTGVTLSLERRLHLLDWACRTGSYVIEDDYDSDFRYDGPPLTALAGLDRRERVIYLGTFSKAIGAGIRIGYAVLPRQLAEQARIAKALLDHGAPWLEQAVIADFLREGAFLRHLRRIRHRYMSARDAAIASIEQHFPGSTLSGRECGMHMMWTLPPGLPAAAAVQRLALDCGVGLYPLRAAASYEQGKRGKARDRVIVLGYTGLGSEEICDAIARVAHTLRRRAPS